MLRLSVKQIKALQAKHNLTNLLAPEGKDLTIDLLADIYYEGTRSWTDAPTLDQVENLEMGDLTKAFRDFLSQGIEGNG